MSSENDYKKAYKADDEPRRPSELERLRLRVAELEDQVTQNDMVIATMGVELSRLEERVEHRLGTREGRHLNPDITLLELATRLGALERKLDQ
jgi:hypothetical protein